MNVEERVRQALHDEAARMEVPDRPDLGELDRSGPVSWWRGAVVVAAAALAVLVVVNLAGPTGVEIDSVEQPAPPSAEETGPFDPGSEDTFGSGETEDGVGWVGVLATRDGIPCVGVRVEGPGGGTAMGCRPPQPRTPVSLTVYRADPEIVGVAGWVADDVARAVWELPGGPVELEIYEHPDLPQRVFAAAGRITDDTTMIWVYDDAGERLGGAGVGSDRGPVGPDASPDETLTIPTEAGVHPVFLHDGTPAFVVNQPDTGLRVLHAVSPHQPNGIRKAVVWCPRTERFVDPWHGSRFSVDGTWLAGPAPTGLSRYEAWVGAEPTIVRIGERLAAPARPSNTAIPTPGQPGPRCDIDQDGRIRDAIVAHSPPAGAPTTVEDASDEAILYVDPMTVELGR